jgi:hypothetical protein
MKPGGAERSPTRQHKDNKGSMMYVEKTATPQAVVEHYKAVNELLTEVGFSTRARAGRLGKSAQTLKQYSVKPESAQHRLIPPSDLDTLRSIAIDEFWRRQWTALSKWAAAEGFDGMKSLPTYWRVEGQAALAGGVTHFLFARVQEVADETGGHVVCVRGEDKPVISVIADRRSRWRQAVFKLQKKVPPEDVKHMLTEISGYCEYSVMRIGIEYLPFRISPQEDWITALEKRIAA